MATTKVTTGGITDATIATADIADNAVTSAKIADGTIVGADLASSCIDNAKLAANAVTSAKIADGTIVGADIASSAIDTAKIADQAVTLAKLPHGTSSNDGKFLRANNGADPSFETITGTTINNNADNRVITGSGTANTLEAESGLSYDGNELNVTGIAPTISFTESNGDPDYKLAANAGVFKLVDTTNSADRVVVSTTGNVGIGTTSPDQKLIVADTSQHSLIRVTAKNDAEAGIDFGDTDDNDAGRIRYGNNGDYMRFYVNATERLRIDSSGRLLVGTTNNTNGHISASKLAVQGADLAIFKDSEGDNSGVSGHKLKFVTQSGSLGEIDVLSEGGGGPSGRGGAMRFYTKANNTGSASEGMRLTSGNRLLVNTTTNYNGMITGYALSGQPYPIAAVGGNTSQGLIGLYYSTSLIGSITITGGGSSVAYNTSSDYRLKENVVDLSNGIARLKTLIPRRFNWKDDKSTTVDGFVAHEVTAVPEAVTGTKDQVVTEDNEETGVKKGDPIYQQIDQSKLVPLLTAALQEAIAKIEVLETKVAALEAA